MHSSRIGDQNKIRDEAMRGRFADKRHSIRMPLVQGYVSHQLPHGRLTALKKLNDGVIGTNQDAGYPLRRVAAVGIAAQDEKFGLRRPPRRPIAMATPPSRGQLIITRSDEDISLRSHSLLSASRRLIPDTVPTAPTAAPNANRYCAPKVRYAIVIRSAVADSARISGRVHS